ncbi:hypothetical protein HBI23_252310 [Parastagonospora nodorum]|nr:hypothetical protein HBI23_252310 [Parastagonospora nodorum]
MKLVAAAREEGLGLMVASIFQHPRLVGMATVANQQAPALIDDIAPFSLLHPGADVAQVREEVAASCKVDARLVEDIYPCSPLQEGLMSLTSKRAGDYILQCMLELERDVNENALRGAWEQVYQSLQVLRTRILHHSTLGLLQAVVADKVRWIESDDLEAYLRQDKSYSMYLGEPLTRYALVRNSRQGKCWLVWTVHHTLYDDWSLPRILKAVGTIYSGAKLEHQPSFATFAKYLGQLDQGAIKKYWEAELCDCEAALFPPLPPEIQQTVADTIQEYQCPPLPKLTTDATASTLVRAAWAVLVSWYTSVDDVVFGATVTGRNAPVTGIEAMAGPTIATVPLRLRFQKDWNVSEFLETVQRQATSMIPFEQTGLQQIAKLGPGPRHACGFQTLLVVQPIGEELEIDDMFGTWKSRSNLQNFTTYALMVQCTLAKEGIKVTASFDRRVIDQWQVRKMLGQFSSIMQQLAQVNPSTKVGDIDTLTPEDRKGLWDRNQNVPPAVDRCVHDLFAEQARARPSAPALCAWDGEMTYRELDEQSTRLAGHLIRLGVAVEDMVPLCFEKSMWTVVAMLAVLKAGGAFVPLDPDHPASRHEEIFRQTGAKVVLVSVQNEKLLARSGRHVVAVSASYISQLPTVPDSADSLGTPENAAYVLFTSGSTGVPKGVVLEHRATSTSCLGHGRVFEISESTRALQFSNYTFDNSITEIITTLLYGACICVPSESDRRNNLANAATNMKVDWAILTSSVARLLDPVNLPTLKTLVIGAEQVSFMDWNRWPGNVQIINGYGPTECCVICTAYSTTEDFKTGTIGKSIASVSWVVDSENHHRLAPLGSIGELLVEGPILARGYLNDAEKTAAAFIDDPAWLLEGCVGHAGRQGRLYKTGDLVRYDGDGNLVCVGRKDGQVKLRGQRIELGEVEHHVRECLPHVKQLAVEVVQPSGEKDHAVLAAFVQLDDKTEHAEPADGSLANGSTAHVIFPAGLEEALASRLAEQMVPTVFFAVPSFPMTNSGKTDRRRLREIGSSFTTQHLADIHTSIQGPKRYPETKKEKLLQRLWARALRIRPESIGLDDSFFRLGGDSIAAMKLVGEARRESLQLSVADIFHHAKLIDLTVAAVYSDEISPPTIPSVEHADTVEQSFAQGRLWFLEELYPGLNWYLMPFAVRIRGPLQLSALQTAIFAIESRHETLRTTFATENGVSVQTVHPFRPKDLHVISLSASDECSRLDAIQRDQMTPFDLRIEPGWRATVYRLDENDHVLSIVMHHIISDGWSAAIITRELSIFYAASIRGQDPFSQTQRLPVQYRDFSVWQRQQVQMEDHRRQLSYWLTQLQTSRPAELLCDKPRPATLSGKADTRTIVIDGPVYDKLQQFCKNHGVTLFVALLTIFRATHFRLTGQDDATIGTVNANRDRWELRDMIGFFVNMQCLRTTIADESFEELLQQVQAVTVASLANQDVPFESIVSKLKNDRDLSRHPLVQLVFVVHSQRDLGQLILEGVETEVLDGSATSRFDLEFHFFQQPDGLLGEIIFSTDLYAPATIENMVSVFASSLEECLKVPAATIASLPLLTDADDAKLDAMGLIGIQKTAYPRESSIVDLFHQQASAYPSRVAVKDSLEEMTYAKLDEASDSIARWLQKRSFAPETLVGVFANRCCWTIVTFLGILKAGLAYLPFDVKTPSTRMEAILSSLSGPRIIFVGAGVQPPDVKLKDIAFVHIAEALDEKTDEGSGSWESTATLIRPSAASLAYVMYTSGSTGKPKGVMVEHRGIVRLVRDNNIVQHMPVNRVMAHITNLAFDVSTWEIFVAILNGGTLVCIDTMIALDSATMLQTVSHYDIQMAVLTPALFRHYVSELPAVIAALGMLCVGGEALHPQDFFAAEGFMRGKLINCYGPTENTGISTSFVLTKDEKYTNGVPIGRALSNSGAYVMDSYLRLVPLGVIGELVVTGDGVARGYIDPQHDIGRFISVEIRGKRIKAYRTGDFARHRPVDGQLEFFGRMDGQVKVRGQRIELGEIEHVLRSHKSVTDAVAVLQHHDGNEAQLAGFVTIHEDVMVSAYPYGSGGDEAQHVDTWEKQFDAGIYLPIDDIRAEGIGRDFVGWTSMYDGSEIDKKEMNEWLDETIATMLNGCRPGHILEIGSGTGMILFNLGDELQSYVGLDPSRNAVEFVERVANSNPVLADKVRIHKATAAEVSKLQGPILANLVVLNSVVQYFPSQEYLFKAVQELLGLGSVRTLFFGDIRSYALYREFLAIRVLHIVGDKATKADFRHMMADMERVERELLVDPAFFTALPNRLPGMVEHVEILPKRMEATNELSCFRYTAVIHARAQGQQEQRREVRQVKEEEWIDFTERRLNRQSLLQQLKALSSLPSIAISNIPNSKTIGSRCLLQSLDNMAADPSDHQDWLSSVHRKCERSASFSAKELVQLAQEASCRVEISWNRQHSQHGGLDAIFHRYQPKNGENRVMFQFPTDHAERPLHSLSNKPLQQQFLQRAEQHLREMLQDKLPAYMVPQTITVLDVMPTNQNGKVDRKTLARREQKQATRRHGPVQQPKTAAERTMQQLWGQILNIEPTKIGLDNSFFRLGGDSIAAMKLVSEARKMGVQLSVADIFRRPKLAALASLNNFQHSSTVDEVPPFSLLAEDVDVAKVREDMAAICGVDADLVTDIYPCSPLQEGLMSLTAKRAGDYVMQSVLALRSDVDEEAFRAAWQHVMRSTAALRTRIVQHSKLGLLQVVVEEEEIHWTEAKDLEEYLHEAKSALMGLGDQLTRFAFVKEPCGGKRWFAWTIHHALYDGWSLPRVLRAVYQAYNGTLPNKPPGFNAFVQYLSQQDQEAATAYWQTALANCEASPFPLLPSTVAHPVADTIVTHQCPPISERTLDTTMSTLIRAAWAVVTSRYTSSDDVVFGATVTGRNAPVAGIEDMVGLTIATVPVRVYVPNGQAVSTFLESLQQQATDMIAHEQTGLQQIAMLGPGARQACSFQTLLVVQPISDMLSSEDMLGEWHGYSELQDFTTYALMVQCTLAAEGIQITASFDARVVEHWVVEKMLSQFSFVLEQLAEAGAEKRVADIDTTTTKDREQLWSWNQDVPPAIDQCVHELFAEQVKLRPDAPALCAWDGELSYGELDVLSSRLADHLVQLGVKPEDVVPLCFEKSMWTVVAMLAVLKAGGAFVMLDPDHPASRHEEIFRQTGANIMLASAQHSARWASPSRRVSLVEPGNVAYIMFTSGSTGEPKGVVIEHRAVSTSCLGHGRAFGITDHARVLQFTAYTFDVCLAEIITTLLYGGCICVPSDNDRRNNLARAIEVMKVNWAYLTPSVARLLDTRITSSLEVLVLGGEQVNSADWDRWPSSVQMINGYGPTECCVFSTGHVGRQGFKSGNVGKSIASASWVVDSENHHRLAPLGSIGELLVEGPILARGYLNDAEKTAAAFIDDPAWLLEGCVGHAGRQGRLYKTGDLVRYDGDGNLVCVGRKDGQVKVRGQRVELGEIERHLRECIPEAEQMAVEAVLPSGEKDRMTLAAFIRLDGDARFQHFEGTAGRKESRTQIVFLPGIEEELEKRLPDHMVPTTFFGLLQFPITTSGKTDRKRLREIGASFTTQQLSNIRTSNQGPKRQPSTDEERTMHRLWAQVLRLEPDSIGLDDSFFRLGGDSISAMKLADEARKICLELSVADLLRNSTLASMARRARPAQQPVQQPLTAVGLLSATTKAILLSKIPDTDVDLHNNNVFDILPTTHMQDRFISRGIKFPALAFNYFFMDLGQSVDSHLLQLSCTSLLQRLPILRTKFISLEGKLWQIVLRDPALSFSEIELGTSLEEGSNAICAQNSESSSPLELATSFTLVKSASMEYRLILRLSHAQYDGFCIPLILETLFSIYHKRPLGPLYCFSQYLAYVHGRRSLSELHWRKLLEGSQMTNVTSIFCPNVRNDTTPSKIKKESIIDMPRLPEDFRISAVVSSAWATVLSHITGAEDVVYGYVVAGRNSNMPGITQIIGPCVNVVPVRARVLPTATSTQLLRSIQEQQVSLGESDSMGFDDIVRSCTDWPATTKFDSVLQHQNIDEDAEFHFADAATRLQWFQSPSAVSDLLSVTSYPQGDKLKLVISGNTHIMNPEHADMISRMLCDMIMQLSAALEMPPRDPEDTQIPKA